MIPTKQKSRLMSRSVSLKEKYVIVLAIIAFVLSMRML